MTLKLDALPDGGKKLQDEVRLLTDSLRQLDIQISSVKTAQNGT